MQMDVTSDERNMILAYRREAEGQRQQKAIKLLKLAASFEQWKRENGAGATYSTFCDDFGYEAVEGEDRR